MYLHSLKYVCFIFIIASFFILSGCTGSKGTAAKGDTAFVDMPQADSAEAKLGDVTAKAIEEKKQAQENALQKYKLEFTNNPDQVGVKNSESRNNIEESGVKGKRICIDPGHQLKVNLDKEPIAPDSDILKEKMSWGTSGAVTGIPEYKLNLEIAIKLRKAAEEKGAKVVMTRESDDVNSSNIERAEFANRSNSDIVVRIHADGSESSSAKGISILYPGGKYLKDNNLRQKSRLAASKLLEGLVGSTNAVSRGAVERNDLTGFNWSKVPVILVEMGFMTNPDEDRLLSSNEYQDKLVGGMLKGLENYFQALDEK